MLQVIEGIRLKGLVEARVLEVERGPHEHRGSRRRLAGKLVEIGAGEIRETFACAFFLQVGVACRQDGRRHALARPIGIAPIRRSVIATFHVEGQLVRHDGIGVGIVTHGLQNRGKRIHLAPRRHAGVLEQLGHVRACSAQTGEACHLRHICAAETAHGLLTHRAQGVAAIAGEPLGIVRAHTGSNEISRLGIRGLLRLRRAVGSVRRFKRLRFQGFLRSPLIAAAVCADVPIGRQDTDEHNDS